MPADTTRPAVWNPPEPPPLTGAFAENDRLALIERWPLDGARGPEDIAFDDDGSLYTGVEDGRILRFPRGGGVPEEVGRTGGRPLGMEVDRDGTLVISDAYRGLLRVDPETAEVTVLTDEVDGRKLVLTDNASIHPDGRIFFSDASDTYPLDEYATDILEARPHGWLLSYDPSTGETRPHVDRLMFANGVAVAPDGSYVLVAETGRFRIQRLWLEGPHAGTLEPFFENLPGFPDNLSFTDDGRVWVALPVRRNPAYDFLVRRPRLRGLVAQLGLANGPRNEAGFVVCLDGDGRVVDQLQGAPGVYDHITGVRERDGWLYLGALHEDAVARVEL